MAWLIVTVRSSDPICEASPRIQVTTGGGEHQGALARELGVTRRLVELRQEDFARDAHIFQVVDEWRSA